MHTEFWRGNPRERKHLNHQDVDERIILIYQEVGWGMDWTDVSQERGS